jgi:hypothetical protein
MRKFIKPFAIAVISMAIISSCSKEKQAPETAEISQETLSKISALGFSTNDVQKIDEGYLVEGDMILTDKNLNETPNSPALRIANVEQYRTTNLVTAGGGRNITVSTTSTSTGFIAALDAAIARYNAENLLLTFSRVASGGNISISIVNTRQYIASAGFPSNGNPYNSIKYAKAYTTYSLNFMTTVLTHEMGHCIGFRHTDYMDRSYSCGGSYSNEGASTVGAVHIPGTPTVADPNSWMLACLSATTNRPFNANDKVALNYLY